VEEGGREPVPAPEAAAAPPWGVGREAVLPPITTPPESVEAGVPVARARAAKNRTKGPTLVSSREEEDRKVEYDVA